MSTVAENLCVIQKKIQDLQPMQKVCLVAVSKTKPIEDLMACYNAGQRHFGENYLQELAEKQAKLPKDIKWHFIGSLQSNKLKQLASLENLFVVETVDSLKKAQTLDKLCKDKPNPMQIMLQVNTSGEEAKSGMEPDEVLPAAREVTEKCPNLKLLGLMTIGSKESSNAGGINPDFETLRNCRARLEEELHIHGLELSMGMSEDFESAIRQGSTSVRVGSKIFGARNYNL